MGQLISALEEWAELRKLEEGLRGSVSCWRVEGLSGSATAAFLGALARRMERSLLVLTYSRERAEKLFDDLASLLLPEEAEPTEAGLHLFPSLEGQLYEEVAPEAAVVRDRLSTLGALLGGKRCLVIATAVAAAHLTLPPEAMRSAWQTIARGESLVRELLLERLVELGYEREELAEEPGEFAVRGGVVDVFPSTSLWPVRLEFLGEEVESLRAFDPGSQRSVKELERVSLLPARELLLTGGVGKRAMPAIRRQLDSQESVLLAAGREEAARALRGKVEEDLERLAGGEMAPLRAGEYYLPFLFPGAASLVDYLPAEAVVAVEEPARIAAARERFEAELASICEGRRKRGEMLDLPRSLHLTAEELSGRLEAHPRVELELLAHGPGGGAGGRKKLSLSSPGTGEFAGHFDLLSQELRDWQRRGWRAFIFTQQGARLGEMLASAGIAAAEPGPASGEEREGDGGLRAVQLSSRRLNAGFLLPGARVAALTDREVFGWKKSYRPIRRRRPAGIALSSLTQLRPGDYVVHINHGIGVYEGLTRRAVEGVEREYLQLAYAEGDRLYVPADQFDRVQKYLGAGEGAPAVHRLGGGEWERTKRRARRGARELARELAAIYAAREREPGFAFSADSPWQREMEDGFPFEETPDQMEAIEQVKGDMERGKAMDRLICGDVGYGKTEVAIRAAFKAVMDGKQVAVLVPTTVLAQQHQGTFGERLAPYPVRVEMLSRFKSRREQQEIVAGLAAGGVDIVIGTHRLLSKDVRFKDLGLVVVDEEQRFGVRHKEKLKELRTTVDVLTMTATPIPRTLQMALSGLREMSLIADAPEGRMAIRTFAREREEELIREAMVRELERSGQVFFVHNRVESIYHVAAQLERLLPGCRIAVAHGQMAEEELERVMLEFYAGESDVLVCTTIIESGLDIPNANTLVVDQSDRFGLAQLYQLRGRVGRSNRQAYAYLTWTPYKRLTEQAEKRIAAIREFSDLGSGFKLALRDLEIRGAGNLLGPEQHGFIVSVGFDLYCQMLAEAVREARGEPAKPRGGRQVSLDVPVEAYLPAEYVPDLEQRIDLYRRLAGAADESHLERMREEVLDRYGRPLPAAGEQLFRLARLKLFCAAAGVESISREGTLLTIRLEAERELTPALASQLQRPPRLPRLEQVGRDRLVVSFRGLRGEEIFGLVEGVLSRLGRLRAQ
jgi:transcription-repair coupling factor (superfamily II helicase)